MKLKSTTHQRPVALAIGTALAALASPAAFADGIIGLGDTPHHSEFLFGFSGGTPNTLTLDGSTVLSTGDSQFNAGTQNQGWWSATVFNSTGNDNYFVGDLSDDGSSLLNNFFTFDISSLSGPVTSAVLDLQRYDGASSLGATHHTYELYDVSTPAGTLNANDGTSATIFADLGSGVLYGSYSITVAGLSSEILHLTLNAAALADLNAAIASDAVYFSIGGTLFPTTAAVPEAGATAGLLGLGLGLAGWLRRRVAR